MIMPAEMSQAPPQPALGLCHPVQLQIAPWLESRPCLPSGRRVDGWWDDGGKRGGRLTVDVVATAAVAL
ncbi:hypothetical protein NQZ68_018242 [Dissostichus eleginoides]|nr:hypothetical protein NQZ68_018242 [Dissostichus eleginoides]